MTDDPFDPAPQDERDRILRLIMARCPELTEADLALLGDAPDPDLGIPVEIADRILDLIAAFEARLIASERARPA